MSPKTRKVKWILNETPAASASTSTSIREKREEKEEEKEEQQHQQEQGQEQQEQQQVNSSTQRKLRSRVNTKIQKKKKKTKRKKRKTKKKKKSKRGIRKRTKGTICKVNLNSLNTRHTSIGSSIQVLSKLKDASFIRSLGHLFNENTRKVLAFTKILSVSFIVVKRKEK